MYDIYIYIYISKYTVAKGQQSGILEIRPSRSAKRQPDPVFRTEGHAKAESKQGKWV